jgi:hypothetical protein
MRVLILALKALADIKMMPWIPTMPEMSDVKVPSKHTIK